ncbi:nitroreductase [Algiphilus sp. W345]|uniref:Nitroreductase n=1 Tax=Banduia mediterranea TaxID=3075609 RepID=A0ABU2WG27_9GAMM|nr:nitroreductase [Algiphilus sp. W345]MDT0496835.1 nitroreductase [Algiphilus sp. W345]
MNVSEAVDSRRSVRAFLDQPVDLGILREVLERAARAPSGGNLQPWRLYVLSGDALSRLKDAIQLRLNTHPTPDLPLDYEVYPSPLGEPYRSERYAVGEAMYAELGIAREDKTARLQQFANNYRFFGAPVALFCYVDRGMGPPQWSDLGMYLQTVMLLLRERGLDSCAQECWSVYHREIAAQLSPPREWMLFCGMAIGHADPDAPVNRLRARRLPLDQFVQWRS